MKYNQKKYLEWDPLGMLDSTLSAHDYEIVSLIVAGLAYGRVEQIRVSTAKLFECFLNFGVSDKGDGLSSYLREGFCRKELSEAFLGWRHRLNISDDIVDLLFCISRLYDKHNSLAELFLTYQGNSEKEQIISFVEELLSPVEQTILKENQVGASWFVVNPKNNSTCKRLLLWLKWMIRKDEIDPGIWLDPSLYSKTVNLRELNKIQKERLLYPVDTHIHRWALKNNAYTAKSLSFQRAQELSEYFKKINSHDPLKYDFAIVRNGVMSFRGIS